MRRLVLILFVALLCTGCGNVGVAEPTPSAPPLMIEAQLVNRVDMLLRVKNNDPAALDLGGWTIRITPVISPTLIEAMPIPDNFKIPQNKTVSFHTSGGTNGEDVLFFDNGGKVPPEAWQDGIKIELRDPRSDKTITRYIYLNIPVQSGHGHVTG